ncbi:hypothetical protein CEXT_325511 [Caerostris extrusa]|uniref:Uncharacterized protein n=1 Tax=Caerostris extrusa TaxID=172846 RepID=A0AAV4V0B5_CAEEX|nr:hypothetical protein CEXT_325511 [Caerostris extrusa]
MGAVFPARSYRASGPFRQKPEDTLSESAELMQPSGKQVGLPELRSWSQTQHLKLTRMFPWVYVLNMQVKAISRNTSFQCMSLVGI